MLQCDDIITLECRNNSVDVRYHVEKIIHLDDSLLILCIISRKKYGKDFDYRSYKL